MIPITSSLPSAGPIARLVAIAVLVVTGASCSPSQKSSDAKSAANGAPVWTVDSTPLVILGRGTGAEETFAKVVGAARLPDGRIVVGDSAGTAFRLFSATGTYLKSFGPRGEGPGDVTDLTFLLRCGDTLVAIGRYPPRNVLFSLDGTFARTFAFGSADREFGPYATACNGQGMFVHYGWESEKELRGGPYRPLVSYWLSRGDSGVVTILGSFPGSERWGRMIDNQLSGIAPLPLGREPFLAMGTDRVYLGTGDRQIRVFDLAGKALPSLTVASAAVPVTDADIAAYWDRKLGAMAPEQREREKAWYIGLTFPDTLPLHHTIKLDSEGFLWVMDYPRPGETTSHWMVYDREGKPVGQVTLPAHVAPLEIGRDYVLASYFDTDELIPQVKLFRLTRASDA